MFILYTYKENYPTPGGHVFSLITTTLDLVRDIHKSNVFTKVHDDCTKQWTSRVKMPPPPGGHVFLPIQTIFKLNRHWIRNVTSREFTSKTAPPPGGHVFQQTGTIF
ncbi:hypothetical protein DPMN_108217 [Dreissena polymorpha]|uniref:Uncharacterized protein n=1 Tax=Dreissena polymorpha TaxID=45954 RepID=A0A9D4QKY9_DREPO|nr:hypothetical protein DPMN_108217 [Dreissena polymorpha]